MSTATTCQWQQKDPVAKQMHLMHRSSPAYIGPTPLLLKRLARTSSSHPAPACEDFQTTAMNASQPAPVSCYCQSHCCCRHSLLVSLLAHLYPTRAMRLSETSRRTQVCQGTRGRRKASQIACHAVLAICGALEGWILSASSQLRKHSKSFLLQVRYLPS